MSFDPDTPNFPMLHALLERRVPGEVIVEGPHAVALLGYHGVTFVTPGAPEGFSSRTGWAWVCGSTGRWPPRPTRASSAADGQSSGW